MQGSQTKVWIGLALVAAVVVIGGVFFVYSRTALAPTTNVATNTSPTSSSTVLGNGVSISVPAGATVTIIPSGSSVTAPSLTTSIIISSPLSLDAQILLRNKENAVIAVLQKDPNNVAAWLDLAIDRKIGGDYSGAAAIWKYLTKTAPTSVAYIAYGNLGGLYADYLKDYPTAEADYKQAIALSPHTIDYYRELYTIYKYVYKTNTTAAADILVQGIKANPGNPDLLALQAQM